MSSILAIDPEILVVAGMPIAVVVIGGIVALWRRNGNGRRHVEEHHVEEPHVEEHHDESDGG